MRGMDEGQTIAFENRKIALVGSGHLCRHFYLQFHSRLDIEYCFTVGIDEGSASPDAFLAGEENIKCMPLKEALIRENNLLLILCCRHGMRKPYDDLLLNKGFEWGEDYIDYIYVIHYYQKYDRIALAEKKIWIFGAGNNGKGFYQRYRECYQICGFISNFEGEKEFQNLPVIRPADIMNLEDFYIVICSEAEAAMAGQLLDMGLVGGVSYGFADMLPKKLFVAMGTCQIIDTTRVLYRNVHFSSQYNVGAYFDNIYRPCSEADNRRMKGYGVICDVVFYNIVNAGSVEQRSYEPLIDKFYEKADRIFMPFYYFRGQLMQITVTENDYRSEIHGLLLWLRGDREINQMVENGVPEEKILETISGDDYWTKEQIVNNFERELKKVAILDRLSSFPIRKFIEDNYKKMTVFDDGFHFCIYLHLYIANEITRHLHLQPVRDQETVEKIERLQKSVLPVYPCVRKALGMETEDSYRFYNAEQDETEYLSFEEYGKRYIRYVTAIREIFGKSGTSFRY